MLCRRFLGVLFVVTFRLFSQNGYEEKIDSLETTLRYSESDTVKIELMCLLARAYGGIDSTRVFKNAYEALELSNRVNSLYGKTYAYHAIAGGYLDYFDIKKAKEYYFKAQDHANTLIKQDSSRRNLQLWAKTNFNLGVAYGYQGNHEKEIEYVEKTIPVANLIKDTLFLAIANTNLAIKYLNFAKYKEAYSYFMRANEQYKTLGNTEDIVFNNINLSLCLYEMNSLPEMKKTLDVTKAYLDTTPNSMSWADYYANLGLYFSGIKEYPKAIKMYDKAFKVLEEKKMYGRYASLYLKYAETYEHLHNYALSKKYMLDFLRISLETKNDTDRIKAYYRLSGYEAKTKNFEEAYTYLNRYIKLLDSIGIEETSSKIKQLELQYQAEKKEKEILQLKNTNNYTNLHLEKKKSQLYLMIMASGALLFLFVIGFLVYRAKLKEGRLKERKYIQEMSVLKHDQQTKVFSAMIEGQEKERKRLAIDLHDGLGGRLSAISLKLSKLDNDKLQKYPKEELTRIREDIKDSLSELRSIARNLMPETLIKFGLKAALQDYCSNMNTRECKVTLQFYDEAKMILLNDQVTIYRIVQELINNAVKHAEATEVLVQYIYEKGKVDIAVEDNGIGFDLESPRHDKGMGLDNLKTRVEYLKGIFDIQSFKNEGTTVTIQIEV